MVFSEKDYAMTDTIAFTYTTSDPKQILLVTNALQGVFPGGTVAPPPAGGTGGTGTLPAFVVSNVGDFVESPPTIPNQITATLTDWLGNTAYLIYDAGAEFPDTVINGDTIGQADYMIALATGATDPSTGKPGIEIWLWNHAHGDGTNGAGQYVWRDGFVNLAFPLPLPIGRGLPLPPPPVVVVPPGSVVTGPTVTPVTATATGMASAIENVAAGGTVSLSAGVYTETAPVNTQCIISGAGADITTINIQGITPNQKKAALVPGVAGVVIQSLSITGSAIDNGDGGNAAGVRDGGDGIGFDLKNVHIFGNQNGCLTFASLINIDTCEIDHNGNALSGAGTHNLYIGRAPVFNLTNSHVHDCTHEHEVKSRALVTNIGGCVIMTGGLGSCIDQPYAGNLNVSNTTLGLGKAVVAGNQDTVVIHYGEESGTNVGRAIVLTNVIIDGTALPGVAPLIVVGQFAPDATLTLVNCTYKGGTAPNFQGITAAQITGTFAKAA